MSVETIDLGETVICDATCGDDYTGKPDAGGFLFQRMAVCPKCAPEFERNARKYGEDHLITARCPEGMTFQAFVLQIRAGNNLVKFYTDEDADEGMERLRARKAEGR